MESEIKKQRLKTVSEILKNFLNLPPTLRNEKYKKYLLNTKKILSPVFREVLIPYNKVGKVIGHKGNTLKQIEKDYQCVIKINDNICCIEGDKADDVVKYIEEMLLPEKKVFDIEKMNDWERFYVWWAYHNKKI